MHLSRSSGILLHPTSLPGQFGIGDLGQAAYRFIEFLAETGQHIWQVLPLGPTGYGNSPYLSYSALAGNPLLISLEWLHGDGFLNDEDANNPPDFPQAYVDYDWVYAVKMPLLRKAFESFKTNATDEQRAEFDKFCHRHANWVDDYALFMSLKDAFGGKSWNQWESAIMHREPAAMAEWKKRLEDDIYYQKFLQYEFFRQWRSLKKYANDNGVKILGDIPIYVAHDSMAVWAHRDIFCLDEETGKPSQMAGVPPDYFSETGQLWGNPVYDWDRLRETGFDWWLKRFEGTLDYVDIIRIDHFRGFEAYWSVPGDEPNAMKGEWVKAPGDEFFQILGEKLGKLPIVAEDLGVITPEVEALRDKYEFPGMKILQFAFDSGADNPFLPFNYASDNFLVYSGTHDNDTTVGWYEARSPEEKQRVLDYLGCIEPGGISWSLIRMAYSTRAAYAIVPMQDILGLGTESRMNTPSKPSGNWSWRYTPEMLTSEIRTHLRTMTELYGRVYQH